jgi:hypothetical protein
LAPLDVPIERDRGPRISAATEYALPPAGTLTEIVMRETWQPRRREAAGTEGAGELPLAPQTAAPVAVDEGTARFWRDRGVGRQIVAALGVGALLGFVAGYRAGGARQPAAPPAQARADVGSAPPADVPRADVLPAAPRGQSPAPVAEAPASSQHAPAAESAPTPEPRGVQPASSAGRGAAHVASLTIDSKPRGARVFVDGRAAGTTPLVLAHTRVGRHVVRVVRAGYRPWTATVRVRIGRATAVTASLRR